MWTVALKDTPHLVQNDAKEVSLPWKLVITYHLEAQPTKTMLEWKAYMKQVEFELKEKNAQKMQYVIEEVCS